jgi:hypothetical protein
VVRRTVSITPLARTSYLEGYRRRAAVVCALCRPTNFALDDLTFVVTHFLPHLDRDSIGRILKA